MRFNINNEVRVKLTHHGRVLHRRNFDALFRGKNVIDYRPPEEDAEGWSTWQLWMLMYEFGPHLHNGADPAFEIEIEIPEANPPPPV